MMIQGYEFSQQILSEKLNRIAALLSSMHEALPKNAEHVEERALYYDAAITVLHAKNLIEGKDNGKPR